MNATMRAAVISTLVVVLIGAPEHPHEALVSPDRYVAAWAEAWSRADPYDAARFYAPDVQISYAQPDLELTNPAGYSDTTTHGEGRAWLASWLAEHSDPHTRDITGVFVADRSIAATLTIAELNTAVIVLLDIDERGTISRQTTLRWREARKSSGAPDPRLGGVDDLVAERLAAWPDGGALLAEVQAGDLRGSAVFVTPGLPSRTVAFVIENPSDACRTAVVTEIGEAGDVTERRFADSRARCAEESELGSPPGLHIPPPVDDQVTGWVPHPDGGRIPLFNSTAELEALATWGLTRFVDAGLEPPRIDSFAFAPVRQCATLSGVVVEGPDRSADVVLCTDAFAACVPDRESCTAFDVSARFGLLHELAHAWLSGSITPATTDRFLAARNLAVWRDGATPWHERGVEHAAEILAWGLMDERIPLVRLGDPPCPDLVSGYALLTGAPPLRTCDP